jgi:hypothetical protein
MATMTAAEMTELVARNRVEARMLALVRALRAELLTVQS